MKRRCRRRLLLLLATCTLSLLAQAEITADAILPGWDLYGSNTVRFDQYDAHGPGFQSAYPFEGPMIYDELGLVATRQDRDYARWRAQIFGVANTNDYRSPDMGVVPERMNLTREVGDTYIPYRWEVGDYFSYLSYMTQQRSLKGGQVELQPRFGNRVDSLVVFGGANEPEWHDLTFGDDYSSGASYLLNSEHMGAWNFNAVYNHRTGRERFGQLDRDQVVASAAVEQAFNVARQHLTFEGEYAHFDGDHDGLTTAATGQDRSGKGYLMELRGYSDALPLDYRFRGERYSKDFRPRGGVVTADRRSAEMHAGWRFGTGVGLRLRYQLYDDLFETTRAEIETRVAGANLSGPLFAPYAPNLIGQVDFFVQDRDNMTDTIDLETINLSADFSQPLPGDWFGRLGFFMQNVEDHTTFDTDIDTWQVAIAADHTVAIGPFIGMISPGMLARLLRDNEQHSDEFQPTLGLRLGYQEHSIGFNYGALMQERLDTGITDISTHTVSADYRYTFNRHVLGAEFNFFGFNPDPGANTEAWNVGVFWTYQFERTAARGDAGRTPLAYSGAITSVDVLEIAPGLALPTTVARLTELNVTGATAQGGLDVYEYRVLSEIEQRQRLAIVHSAGQVDASAVVIDFERTGGVDSVAQTFERVRKALIDRYGAPSLVLEEGEFTPNYVLDINAQRLLRVMEWETPAGVLRFGIPRRIDGLVRMEIQHRRSFPPPHDMQWSLENIR